MNPSVSVPNECRQTPDRFVSFEARRWLATGILGRLPFLWRDATAKSQKHLPARNEADSAREDGRPLREAASTPTHCASEQAARRRRGIADWERRGIRKQPESAEHPGRMP